MTEREITSLALKLFAIYVLVQMLGAIPTLIVSLATAKDFLGSALPVLWLSGAAVTAVLIALTTASLLWKLASKALSKTSGEREENSFYRIEAAILSGLGLYLIVQALIRLSYGSAGAYVQYVVSEPGEIPIQTAVLLIVHILEAVIGLSLILRTDGWVSLLRRVRNAGLSD